MPRLFSLRNREGVICGAFGLRSANRNLFLEQYLANPVEQVLGVFLPQPLRGIVEVGENPLEHAGAEAFTVVLTTVIVGLVDHVDGGTEHGLE